MIKRMSTGALPQALAQYRSKNLMQKPAQLQKPANPPHPHNGKSCFTMVRIRKAFKTNYMLKLPPKSIKEQREGMSNGHEQ